MTAAALNIDKGDCYEVARKFHEETFFCRGKYELFLEVSRRMSHTFF